MDRIKEFQYKLLDWYKDEARILPWRESKDAYKIWISEIMLQQTRVDVVIPYFNRFIDEIPDVLALSKVSEEKLLKLWQGLGYYNRALNLKKTAILIVQNHQSRIPANLESLLALPGIGKYTAGAILSIAYGQPITAVDGNILRIMARIGAVTEDITTAKTKKLLESVAMELIPSDDPGDFNQALMDVGASICIPNGEPKCAICPIIEFCEGNRRHLTQLIPARKIKKSRNIEKKTILLLSYGSKYALRKREAGSLLPNLWELPNFDGHLTEDQCRQILRDMGIKVMAMKALKKTKHVFTHLEWHMMGYFVTIAENPEEESFTWASKEEIRTLYSIPKAFQLYLEQETADYPQQVL